MQKIKAAVVRPGEGRKRCRRGSAAPQRLPHCILRALLRNRTASARCSGFCKNAIAISAYPQAGIICNACDDCHMLPEINLRLSSLQ